MSAPTLPQTRSCVSCGRAIAATSTLGRELGVATHGGRGLCRTCWTRAARAGTLDDYERRTYTRDELLDEWTILRGQGLGRIAAAERLGVSFAALGRALQRARAAGDARAVRGAP